MNAPTIAEPDSDTVDNRPLYPLAREWEITEWTDKTTGDIFRRTADGIHAERIYDNERIGIARLEERVADGDVYASAVTSVAPLVREVMRLRDIAEYLVGPPDCLESECDHVEEADDGTLVGECPDIQRGIATAGDACRIHRIRDALADHDKATAATNLDVTDTDQLIGHVHDMLGLLARIREIAIGHDDGL